MQKKKKSGSFSVSQFVHISFKANLSSFSCIKKRRLDFFFAYSIRTFCVFTQKLSMRLPISLPMNCTYDWHSEKSRVQQTNSKVIQVSDCFNWFKIIRIHSQLSLWYNTDQLMGMTHWFYERTPIKAIGNKLVQFSTTLNSRTDECT